jgi:flavin-dependent dehydrogenase
LGRPLRYDVAIAGAGPAGSVLAFLAAKAGLRVLLAERSHFEHPRIGETAPPELRPLLKRIGLGHILSSECHRETSSVVSVWGSQIPSERHHIFSPYGTGLHLDRRSFDKALALAARAAGADLRLGTGVRFKRRGQSGFSASLGGREDVHCDLAILASGRAAGGMGLPYARCYLDDQVGVAGRFVVPAPDAEPRTVIEAIPGGWFYLAAIPGNELIAVFMTMADLVPAEKCRRYRWWLEALAKTHFVRRALAGLPLPTLLSVHDARSSYAKNSGHDWFSVGDHRFAPDPLSGQGIIWAIADAVGAAEALTSGSHREFGSLTAERTLSETADYVAMRDSMYRLERRFQKDAYWSKTRYSAQPSELRDDAELKGPLPRAQLGRRHKVVGD